MKEKNLKWISRVPFSIKKAKDLVKALVSEELQESEQKGYSYKEEKVTYGGIEQRWVVVESEERKKADLKKLSQEIEQESIKVQKQIAKLLKDEFDTQSLGISKVKEFESKLKYHQIVQLEIMKHQITKKKEIYKISFNLGENQAVIVKRQRQAGRFILATNILEVKDLNADELLKVYKQQQSCERGFRFIKDPLFFADSLFVKNPERVETMMMLMGLDSSANHRNLKA